MTKKMKKESGFTLVEMLIVVAIIAILIAVSIPLVSSSLERAREATDAANERAFKAVLTVGYLVGDADMGAAGAIEIEADGTTVYAYDAVKGTILTTGISNGYGQSEDVKGHMLCGYVKTTGEVVIGWDDASTTLPATTVIDSASANLLSLKLTKGTT